MTIATWGGGVASVLAGWVADEKDWASFSDEWQSVLGMRPGVRYFKWSEAWSLSGKFSGISAQSRDEKVKALMRIIADHNPLAITSVMPTALYNEVFGANPDKVIRHPYFFSLNGLVALLAQFLAKQGRQQRVDFVFDIQDGQMEPVLDSWNKLLETAPANLAAMIETPPRFLRSITTMPLQAADLCAGWTREQAEDALEGRASRVRKTNCKQISTERLGGRKNCAARLFKPNGAKRNNDENDFTDLL